MKAIKTVTIALGLLLVAGRTPAPAQHFNQFVGNWSGSGTITVRDGSRERLRCRGRFTGGGNALTMGLRCASDSYNFELQSNATHSNGAVSGTWAETTRGVGGNLEGNARGNAIHVRVSGIISALLAVSTNANQQSISIQAPGTEMSLVAISLSRK